MLRRSQKTPLPRDSWIRRAEDSIRRCNGERLPVFGTRLGQRPLEAGTRARGRPHIRRFTVSHENRNQLALSDDSIFYVYKTPTLRLVMKRLYLVCIVILSAISAKAGVFPDCSYSPPPGWNSAGGDPVFVLSQDYPTTDPSQSLEQPWKAIDFRQQPAAYMQAVIDYCYEGNLEVEFRGQDNATRKWYHAPWLHPDQRNRHN